MHVTETLSDGLKRAFTVVLPAADIEQRRTKRLAELGKTLAMPGFRPGRVPMTVIKQRYGTAVAAEVLEESVSTATDQVLSDRGLRPAGQPKVDVLDLETATGQPRDLEFKVELELLPEITIPDMNAIEITRLKAVPAPETVDAALQQVALRNRETVPIEEDRAAEPGDVLQVDYTGRVDGVPFEGAAGKDADVEVGGAGFIPGFTEQMAGMRPGETKTIEVTFPPDYSAANLAGKAAQFETTAKALKRYLQPALDDAFAEKLGFDTIDRVRDLLAQQVQREYDQMSRMRTKRKLLDALAEVARFEVPGGMVEAEFEQIWQRLEADRAGGEVDEDDRGKDDDTLRAEYRGIAERRVRLGLLLAEIGRVNGISVAPDEMTRAMRTEASRYGGQEAKVMEFFRKNPQAAETLRGPIFEEKVVDFVLELAKVTDQIVSAEELAQAETVSSTTDVTPEAASPEAPEAAEAGQTEGTPNDRLARDANAPS